MKSLRAKKSIRHHDDTDVAGHHLNQGISTFNTLAPADGATSGRRRTRAQAGLPRNPAGLPSYPPARPLAGASRRARETPAARRAGDSLIPAGISLHVRS